MIEGIKRVSVLALFGAVLVSLFVIACGGDATATPRPTSVPPAATSIPAPTVAPAPGATPTAVAPAPVDTPTSAVTPAAKQQGTLILMLAGLPGIAAGGIPSQANRDIAEIVANSLEAAFRLDPNGIRFNGLAESWSINENGSVMTLKIRRGIPFHTQFGDWGEVTAEDLQWSIEEAGKTGSLHTSSRLGNTITSMEIPDPYTLVINMKKAGDHFFMLRSLGGSRSVQIGSKKYAEAVGLGDAAKEWVGSGPWKFADTQPGYQVDFEAVEDHWLQTPEWEFLVYKSVPEPSSQLAAIRTGETDAGLVPFDLLSEVERTGVRVIQGAGGRMAAFTLGGQYLPSRALPDTGDKFNETWGFFDTDAAPWIADPSDHADSENALKVRKALNFAIDRQLISETIYQGLAPPAAIRGINPGTSINIDLDPSWVPYPFDPTEAKLLLAEAGFPDGFKMSLDFGVRTYAEDSLAQAVARMWEDIGIDVSLRPGFDYRAPNVKRTYSTSDPEAFLFFWSSNGDDEISLSGAVSGTRSTTDNLSIAELEVLDNLYFKAQGTFDKAERAKVNHEIAKLYYESFLVVPVVFAPKLIMVSSRIGEYPYAPGRLLPYPEVITRAR